jgi:hypothetical protein
MPPPPGLAFGESDDRLQRGIQYAVTVELNVGGCDYWITRFLFSPGT